MREFLEKNYKETSGKETIKLAIRALLEVYAQHLISAGGFKQAPYIYIYIYILLQE
jgi:20S proteasome alpha/beta subunit